VRAAAPVVNGVLTTGARSEVVALEQVRTAASDKVGRQIFARVPGVLVYDMDGTGNQLNVGTRGVDPHRSWEMNVRQDGVLLNSDSYGYPASHYSPPLESIEQVTLVRGTAALQYGAQLGGMVDYVTRGPDTTRALAYRGSNTLGSFAQRSTFHSVGGRAGAMDWLVYGAARTSEGWRDVADSRSLAAFARLDWRLSERLLLRAQTAFSGYRYRIPGPLTDAQFTQDPRQATRTRNYYSPEITVPAIMAHWTPTASTELRVQYSALRGARNSVQFVGFATTPDALLPSGQRAPRQVDIDNFASNTLEARLLHRMRRGGREHQLVAGVVYMHNDMRRRQQGTGTSGDDWDLSLSAGDFRRDVYFRTRNTALFAEQLLALTPAWSVVPGVRVELGESRLEGRVGQGDARAVRPVLPHRFPLFGVRSEYRLTPSWTMYGGVVQSYRPQLLKDALPDSPLERVDAGLRDIRGWNLEAGVRGTHARSGVTVDAGLFSLRSDGRFGVVARDSAGSTWLVKTSLGASSTTGLEVRADVPLVRERLAGGRLVRVAAFTGTSVMRARYRDGSTVDGGVNRPLSGRVLEGVPTIITRNGLDLQFGRWTATILSSYTSASYADPLNTVVPTATGARGLVPAYHVADVNVAWRVGPRLRLSGGLNNVLDRRYFTKRPTIYPGPGVWPSDGRSWRMTVDIEP
jgi:Fe(3+) dicitrate transport protein